MIIMCGRFPALFALGDCFFLSQKDVLFCFGPFISRGRDALFYPFMFIPVKCVRETQSRRFSFRLIVE